MNAISPQANRLAVTPKRLWRQAFPWVIVACALLLPLVSKTFVTFQVTMLMIYAIAIIGLNVLTATSGQFSLGQSAFFAVGAYSTGIAMEILGIPYALAIPLAGLLSFCIGCLFGLPASRLMGVYLAIATFALAFATPQLLKIKPLQPWTGGSVGFSVSRPNAPSWVPVNSDQWLYYVVLAATLVAYVCAVGLIRSRSGRAMLALRDNPTAASSMGIRVARYRMLSFGVSALFTGVAGGLGALVVQFVAPDTYSFWLSVGILVGMVVGGVGWLPGAFIGAAFVLYVPNVAEEISKGLSGAVYGAILVGLVFVLPRGVKGLLDLVEKRRSGGMSNVGSSTR